jgi:hypothetical protein
MKQIIMLVGIIMPLIALSQKTITGKVFDATTNQPLVLQLFQPPEKCRRNNQ